MIITVPLKLTEIILVDKYFLFKSCVTSFSKCDITRYCQVVQLQHIRNGSKPVEKVLHLLELLPSQFDQRGGGKHPLAGHAEGAIVQGVQVGHHQQQV